ELRLLVGRQPVASAGVDLDLLDPQPEGLRVDTQVARHLGFRKSARAHQLNGARPELRIVGLVDRLAHQFRTSCSDPGLLAPKNQVSIEPSQVQSPIYVTLGD